MLTYGDGVCDIDISQLYKFHRENGKMITLTAIQPGSRFGTLDIDDKNTVRKFAEKEIKDGGWINGGYMVIEPSFFDCINIDDNTILEKEPLEYAAENHELAAYRYNGFWQCMDTLRDKQYLDKLLREQNASWVKWKG